MINDLDSDSIYADSNKPWKNASKLKNVMLESGNIFLLYEVWNEDSYQYTAYMVVDKYGVVQVAETKICYPIRLYKTDAISTTDKGESVLIYEAQPDGYLNVFRIQPSSDPNVEEEEEGSVRLTASLLYLSLLAYTSLLL